MRLAIIALLLCLGASVPAQAGTAFSFQGELYNSGTPVNANYDFRFILYTADVGGSQVGTISESLNVPVTASVFTVIVDFGSVFSGSVDRYIEISAKPSSGGTYAIMTPRQKMLATPQALSLSLPYEDVGVADVPDSVFSLTNAGTGSTARFENYSDQDAAIVRNLGDGGALFAETDSNSTGSAVRAYNRGSDRNALEGEVIKPTNNRAALYARTSGVGQAADVEVNTNTAADALYARTTSNVSGSYAGIFVGPVQIQCAAPGCSTSALQVVGQLTKTSGTFRIDHPLDPANKYLSHSFVESPDMKNVYDGTVVLDGSGNATIKLPNWFEALNRDFRYLLTAIGTPSPGVYISREVQGNEFSIAGGTPNAKVSWQVTGIRQDAYAKAYPTPVEEDKSPEERGRYLTPEVFGKSSDLSINHDQHPPVQPLPEASH